MKNGHLVTAVKALKRQVQKYEIERERFEVEERSAKESKEFFTAEIKRLEAQIKQLEKPADTEADKVLKALEG